MGSGAGRRDERDLIAGTLDMLILHALCRGPLHGYAIARFIEQASEDVLRSRRERSTRRSTVSKCAAKSRSEWGASENNRRAKSYRLTVLGRRALESESSQWRRLVDRGHPRDADDLSARR